MYANLKKALETSGVTVRAAASVIGVHENTMREKLYRGRFEIEEAFALHSELLPIYDLRYLFKRTEENDSEPIDKAS